VTYPRAHLVDPVNGGFYHCCSRCVRRAWLCGEDPLTGRSFEHRKAWIETRILQLCEIFAIDLYAYAVMSNHYHIVVDVVPKRTQEWSDEEVSERFCKLHPGHSPQKTELQFTSLLNDPEKLADTRKMLGSLSKFMSRLNQPIAWQANREDGVTGHFWEQRFKSTALLNEEAILSAMAYVDLNPVRAKIVERAKEARHTSFAHRTSPTETHHKSPLANLDRLGITSAGYADIVEWTASVARGGVKSPDSETTRALSKLGYSPDRWLGRVRVHRFNYRAYGAFSLLREYTERLGQQWLRGAKPGLAAPP